MASLQTALHQPDNPPYKSLCYLQKKRLYYFGSFSALVRLQTFKYETAVTKLSPLAVKASFSPNLTSTRLKIMENRSQKN
jgi:hypothetical protein